MGALLPTDHTDHLLLLEVRVLRGGTHGSHTASGVAGVWFEYGKAENTAEAPVTWTHRSSALSVPAGFTGTAEVLLL